MLNLLSYGAGRGNTAIRCSITRGHGMEAGYSSTLRLSVCLSVIFLFAIWLDGHRFMSGSPTFVQMMTSRHLGVAVTLDLKVIGQGRWDRKWVGMGFAVRVPD